MSLYYKFTVKSVGKRILKIDEYLAKLEAKIEWHFFPNTVFILWYCFGKNAICDRETVGQTD